MTIAAIVSLLLGLFAGDGILATVFAALGFGSKALSAAKVGAPVARKLIGVALRKINEGHPLSEQERAALEIHKAEEAFKAAHSS